MGSVIMIVKRIWLKNMVYFCNFVGFKYKVFCLKINLIFIIFMRIVFVIVYMKIL